MKAVARIYLDQNIIRLVDYSVAYYEEYPLDFLSSVTIKLLKTGRTDCKTLIQSHFKDEFEIERVDVIKPKFYKTGEFHQQE